MLTSIFSAFLFHVPYSDINPLNTELNPICFLLALLGAHHFLHVSRIRVKLLALRRIMSYIYIYIYIYDISRLRVNANTPKYDGIFALLLPIYTVATRCVTIVAVFLTGLPEISTTCS